MATPPLWPSMRSAATPRPSEATSGVVTSDTFKEQVGVSKGFNLVRDFQSRNDMVNEMPVG
jgi:hypothetical protein